MKKKTIQDFVHLHLHSVYSFGESVLEIERLVDKTTALGMSSVAVTDLEGLIGTPEFYEKAVQNEIHPVIGCEFRIRPQFATDDNYSSAYRLTLLAENNQGYNNLCALICLSKNIQMRAGSFPAFWELKGCFEGLIAISGSIESEIGKLIRTERVKEAVSLARTLGGLFGKNNFFLELQRIGSIWETQVNKGLMEISQKIGLPLVAGNACRCIEPGDVEDLRVLKAISNDTLDHIDCVSGIPYLAEPREMVHKFSDIPEAIDNTTKIARRCCVELVPQSRSRYPEIKPGKGIAIPPATNFKALAKSGLQKRLQDRKKNLPLSIWKLYLRRLKQEIKIIEDLHLAGYFLVAADIVWWARKAGIPVGPGRGGLSGSLTAYCLKITEIDPIACGLIFERYIHHTHHPFPGFQLDVSASHWKAVVDYLYSNFAQHYHIAPVTCLRYRTAHELIKLLGGYLDIDPDILSTITQTVPNIGAFSGSFPAEIRKQSHSEPEEARIIRLDNLYQRIGRLPERQMIQKTGFMIAKKPLSPDIPMVVSPDGYEICHLTAVGLQKLGLARIFIIELATLDKIQNIVKRIRDNISPGFDLERIPEDDPNTYRLICEQDTDGIFLMESWGMKKLAAAVRPGNLSDIAILVAFFRPKPLESGLHREFIRYKNTRILPFEECVPICKILSETDGVLIYQEQLIAIVHEIAGYTYAQGVGFLKTILQGDDYEMARLETRFMNDVETTGFVSRKKAASVFERFANAGTALALKAHAFSYAKIVYQMAYLKANFPDLFNGAPTVSHIKSGSRNS